MKFYEARFIDSSGNNETIVKPSKKAIREVVEGMADEYTGVNLVVLTVDTSKENICRIIEGSGYASDVQELYDGSIEGLIKYLK